MAQPHQSTPQAEGTGADEADRAMEQVMRFVGILRRRWLADEKATLHELAGEYGVSAERIRQIEVAAMKRLRAALAA